MGDKAASALARLKNKAAESGRSYQLCLQLFCQEEFLRRLAHSKYSQNLVLKGGLFIYTVTGFDSRVTVDVDFLLQNVPNTDDQIRTVVEEIIKSRTDNDFVSFEITGTAPIAQQKKYPGVRVMLLARIKNTRTPFDIDFGVGDIIVPEKVMRQIPTQLTGFENPLINTYSLETTIAEKLDAVLDLMEFSSRMKDYYDLSYLANKFDFSGEMIVAALRSTFRNRAHSFSREQFERVLTFSEDDSMLKKWKAFCRKIKTQQKDFPLVLESMKTFLFEPFLAAIEGKDFEREWSASRNRWE